MDALYFVIKYLWPCEDKSTLGTLLKQKSICNKSKVKPKLHTNGT